MMLALLLAAAQPSTPADTWKDVCLGIEDPRACPREPVPNMVREYLGGTHMRCPKGWTAQMAVSHDWGFVCWRWRVASWWKPRQPEQ